MNANSSQKISIERFFFEMCIISKLVFEVDSIEVKII